MNALRIELHTDLCVSPWEPVGGNIFITAEADQAVPNDIALDLSEVEACLQAELPSDAAPAPCKPAPGRAKPAHANSLQHAESAQLLAFSSSKFGDVWALTAEASGSDSLATRTVLCNAWHSCSERAPDANQYQLVPDARPTSSTSSRNSGDSVVDLVAEDTAAPVVATALGTSSWEDPGKPCEAGPGALAASNSSSVSGGVALAASFLDSTCRLQSGGTWGPIGPPTRTSTRQQQHLPFQQIVRLPPGKCCSMPTISLAPGSSDTSSSQGPGGGSDAAAPGLLVLRPGLKRSRSTDNVRQGAAPERRVSAKQQAGPVGPEHEPAVPVVAAAASTAATGSSSGEVFVRTRAEALARYREKRARRKHGKLIRYHLRKVNADNRPRVKGRFVKKSELLAMMQQQPPEAAAAEQLYELGPGAYATGLTSRERLPPSSLVTAGLAGGPPASCYELQPSGSVLHSAALDAADLAKLGAVPPQHHLDRLSGGSCVNHWTSSTPAESAVPEADAAAAAAAAAYAAAPGDVKSRSERLAPAGPSEVCSRPVAVAGAEAAMAVGCLMLPEEFDFAPLPGTQFEDAAADLLQGDDIFDQVNSVDAVSEATSEHHGDLLLLQ